MTFDSIQDDNGAIIFFSSHILNIFIDLSDELMFFSRICVVNLVQTTQRQKITLQRYRGILIIIAVIKLQWPLTTTHQLEAYTHSTI